MSRAAAPGVARPGEGLVEIDGAGFYAIPDVDHMAPFLMSVVSAGDRWMFVSSAGGLTAGRGDASRALFPYETDDRLHHGAGVVGPATAVRVLGTAGDTVWTPLRGRPGPAAQRWLYKSVVGESVIFEEAHDDHGLRFRYRWTGSDQFGFVRSATLVNEGDRPVRAGVMDGLLGLLPFGLEPPVYQSMSNLTNAYKRSEVIAPDVRLAVYSLESGVVDRPEPAEVLRATVLWSIGLDGAAVTLDPDALAGFEADRSPGAVGLLTGKPGAYLMSATVDLEPGEEVTWHIVADVGQDQIAVGALQRVLRAHDDLGRHLADSVQTATESLVKIMARSDALQRTGDRVATAHQFANVTYNVMRGGIPLSGYRIDSRDFAGFLEDRNRTVARRHREWLASLPESIGRDELITRIRTEGDTDLIRLGYEYLPFGFSRRHGDPSRPWNAFSIRVRDAAGRPVIYYEGNWRDIFQNWEALAMSYPRYLPGMISVFVNASTPDGFNPYRITRHGIDWEVPDPDDPWSNIGYWGDHQIVYLLRLLQAGDRFLPGEIEAMLGERRFSYADVPYRLASYADLVDDPKSTITFDEAAATRAAGRTGEVGDDGRLLWDADGAVHHVTLAEKLIVPALAKLSNFVPGGGIWMNTQRPEWNDANNALVGYGLSMVTLYHLRSYLSYLGDLLDGAALETVAMSREVAEWMARITKTLGSSRPGTGPRSDRERKEILDALGGSFSDYRDRIYNSGFSGLVTVAASDIIELCATAIEHLDHTIGRNRRDDGLYHAYNLIRFAADGSAAGVEHLGPMLEGQVAVLSSGVLTPEAAADLVDALFASAMYRPDQQSFMLYPVHRIPSFLDKNIVPGDAVAGNPLLEVLLEAGDGGVVAADTDGRVRFDAGFANGGDLEAALDRLAAEGRWSNLVAAHRDATLAVYEEVFDHHAYTGRSGSMYGYEGIGSIYWHMVAKLLVAVQEAALRAVSLDASPDTVARLIDAYWRIRAGLGFNKSAAEFGAIPLDPYSHTPAHAGAQQPGMTGLVKEELLTRPLELGVRVDDGEIRFDPLLLRRDELLTATEPWPVYDLDLEPMVVELDAGSLGLTVCQVPVVVSATDGEARIEVLHAAGTTARHPGLAVDRSTSAAVFARSGAVARIQAFIPGSDLGEAAAPDA